MKTCLFVHSMIGLPYHKCERRVFIYLNYTQAHTESAIVNRRQVNNQEYFFSN